MKKAFTLIEIIFIIMILGVLASVALPRLMTTRDDVRIGVSLTEMGMLVSEISSFYTTTGAFSSNVSDMTNVKNLIYTVPWNLLNEEGVLTYSTFNSNDDLEACVLISLKNNEGNLTVTNVPNVVTTVCQGLQGHFTHQKLLGTKLLGGNRIQF